MSHTLMPVLQIKILGIQEQHYLKLVFKLQTWLTEFRAQVMVCVAIVGDHP